MEEISNISEARRSEDRPLATRKSTGKWLLSQGLCVGAALGSRRGGPLARVLQWR